MPATVNCFMSICLDAKTVNLLQKKQLNFIYYLKNMSYTVQVSFLFEINTKKTHYSQKVINYSSIGYQIKVEPDPKLNSESGSGGV